MSYWFQVLRNSGLLGTLVTLSILITIMGLLSPIFIIHIFNRYIAFGLEGTLLFLMIGAISVAIFEFLFRNLRNKIFSKIVINPIKITKLDFLKNYFERIGKNKKNLLESMDVNNQFFNYLSPMNQSNIFDSLFVILIVVFLFFLSKVLTAIFLIILFIYLFTQKRIHKNKVNFVNSNKFNKKDKQIIRDISVNVNYLETQNSYKYIGYNFEKYLDKKLYNDLNIASYENFQFSSNHLLILFSSIIVIGIGSILVVNGNLTIGSLIGFNIFSSRALVMAAGAQRSYFNLLGLNELIHSSYEKLKDSKNRIKGMQLNSISGSLVLEKIDFSYDENNYLLRNFSASINSGEVTCFSGLNGSGKTTLSKLILGLLEPNNGDILIDGTNLKKLSLQWWKSQVSYVPQNPLILNSSIMDNILLGNEKLNEQEVSRLLQTVGLDKELKQTNLTILDDVEEFISKGTLKKIHFARVLAQNAKIFLFDDPLGFLDDDGVKMVLKLIESLKRAKKTIIIMTDDNRISKLIDKKIIISI